MSREPTLEDILGRVASRGLMCVTCGYYWPDRHIEDGVTVCQTCQSYKSIVPAVEKACCGALVEQTHHNNLPPHLLCDCGRP